MAFGEMWVFGKDLDNGSQLYIKIAMGTANSNTICISFHEAESKIEFPYKNNEPI